MLVDRARPERLGELVRHVLREWPDTAVLTEAPALASLPEGTTVVLCVRGADAAWLNQERPVVQTRALRLVLFSDEETTVHLARCAVDFYDWISHRIDCPEGPPAFAVRALQRAACTRDPAIGWYGGNLDEAFARALPGRRLERISASQPYGALVDALRPKPRTWAAVVDLDTSVWLRRSLWAAAEAGRRGRLLLVAPKKGVSWLPRVDARALGLEDAAGRLRAAGIERCVRLAALLELAPGAIEDATRLARAGLPEAEITAIALREHDPGSALARLAQDHEPKRAETEEPERKAWRADLRRRFLLPDWPGRIELAIRHGDLNVATHWAAEWGAATGGSPRARAALARVYALSDDLGKARSLLESARAPTDTPLDEDTRFELLRSEGIVLALAGDDAKALQALRAALDLSKRLARAIDEREELYDTAIQTLIQMGRLEEAQRLLDEWTRLVRRPDLTSPSSLSLARSTANLMLARGDAQAASRHLEAALKQWPDPEHPNRDVLEQMLAQAWLEERRFREAERLLLNAIQRLQRLGRPTRFLRHEHGRALYGLGRFREAEQELRRALSEAPGPESAARTRYGLARCLVAQGKFDEAEALLDDALSELRRRGVTRGELYTSSLYEKARIRRSRGDLVDALELLREVLRCEEAAFGREHPTLLFTLSELGGTMLDLKRPRDAEPLLRRAVRLAEQTGDRVQLAGDLAQLALAQAAQRFAHAGDTARRALEAFEAAEHEPSPALLRELEAIAAPRSPSPSRRGR